MPTLVTPISITLSALALCLAAALPAQPEARADVISGRVTDLTGKPVADARVITTAPGSGVSRTTTTDAAGHYRIFFPGMPPQYQIQVKHMGFAPAQRTVTRHTKGAEQMTVDLQMGGAPLALSLVEIDGSSYAPPPREPDKTVGDGTVPNPVVDILAMKDTLHLSAVQIVALGSLADTLQTRNSRIYSDIRALLAKSAEAGDVSQMAGTVAMMLEEASGNTSRAVAAAQKLLRSEQWEILPQAIRDRPETAPATTAKQ